MVFGWLKKKTKEAADRLPPEEDAAAPAAKLPVAVDAEIKRLCAEGDRLAEDAQWPEALALYWDAFDLLPEPKTDWAAGTWILSAVGDANFLSGDFEAGRDNLGHAMHYPDAIGNPFLHLRLGQCQFELGVLDRAADELARAYMGAGAEIFAKEDAKYFDFLKTRLRPPPSGQW